MNLKLLSMSGVRKVEGKSLEELSGVQAEALAWAQAVGIRASAGDAEKQGWKLSAAVAIAIQIAHEDVKERLIELSKHKSSVIDALRSATLTQAAAGLGYAKDVKPSRMKESKDAEAVELDSPQALMARAIKRVNNYYDNRIGAAWSAGIHIEYDETADGLRIPESAGALQKRVQAAIKAKAPATGRSDLVGQMGRFTGDVTALIKDDFTLAQSAACKSILDGAKAVILRVMAGAVSLEDAKKLGDELLTVGGYDAPLENIPESESAEGTTEGDESREAIAKVA